jgi:hypothetical protein
MIDSTLDLIIPRDETKFKTDMRFVLEPMLDTNVDFKDLTSANVKSMPLLNEVMGRLKGCISKSQEYKQKKYRSMLDEIAKVMLTKPFTTLLDRHIYPVANEMEKYLDRSMLLTGNLEVNKQLAVHKEYLKNVKATSFPTRIADSVLEIELDNEKSERYLLNEGFLIALESKLVEAALIDKGKDLLLLFSDKGFEKIAWKGHLQSLAFLFCKLFENSGHTSQKKFLFASQRFLVEGKDITVRQLYKSFNHLSKKIDLNNPDTYPPQIEKISDAIQSIIEKAIK